MAPKAQAAPTDPRAPPEQLGSRLPRGRPPFLRRQAQERGFAPHDAANAYFMPAPVDRAVGALRRWIGTHGHVLRPLPPPMASRQQLLSRWEQHTAHCVHCQQGLVTLRKWRRNTYVALVLALLLARFWPARLCGSWVMPSALSEDTAPSARLVAPKAQTAPNMNPERPEPLGGSRWPQHPASGRPEGEEFPLSTTRCGALCLAALPVYGALLQQLTYQDYKHYLQK